MTEKDALALAIDVRRGFKRFKDISAADRPAVVQALRTLSDAKLQELLAPQPRHGGYGIAHHTRVG